MPVTATAPPIVVIEIDAVEPPIKISCLGRKVIRIDRRVERVARPQQPDKPIDRGRLVDPAKRQGGGQINTLLRNGAQLRPFGLFPRLPKFRVVGDDRVGVPAADLIPGNMHQFARARPVGDIGEIDQTEDVAE